jgi:hypothetical protein
MQYIVCPGCKRSVQPLERIETDKKAKKTYRITYCPFERCNFNIDLELVDIKLWNKAGYFEDYTA